MQFGHCCRETVQYAESEIALLDVQNLTRINRSADYVLRHTKLLLGLTVA